jgi:hypothetical protein
MMKVINMQQTQNISGGNLTNCAEFSTQNCPAKLAIWVAMDSAQPAGLS